MPGPVGAPEPITTEQAIELIRSREHIYPEGIPPEGMDQLDAVCIDMLQKGVVIAALDTAGQLCFGPGPNHPNMRQS